MISKHEIEYVEARATEAMKLLIEAGKKTPGEIATTAWRIAVEMNNQRRWEIDRLTREAELRTVEAMERMGMTSFGAGGNGGPLA